MSGARTRLVIQAVISACIVASLPWGALHAQQAVVATARISPRPITTGPDSGKYFVSLEISGIPEVALRGIRLDQILLVDEARRAYTPSGIAFRSNGNEQTSLVAAYLGTAQNTSRPGYFFLVAPGSRTFELRLPGLKPVRVGASLVRLSR